MGLKIRLVRRGPRPRSPYHIAVLGDKGTVLAKIGRFDRQRKVHLINVETYLYWKAEGATNSTVVESIIEPLVSDKASRPVVHKRKPRLTIRMFAVSGEFLLAGRALAGKRRSRTPAEPTQIVENRKESPMAFGVAEWGAIAAMISAMADTITLGKSTFVEYLKKRQQEPGLNKKAEALRSAFSTYSDDEIEAIERRIERCRDRFIDEGSGEARRACLCSVLRDVKDGNGGTIPDDEWANVYNQLGCAA